MSQTQVGILLKQANNEGTLAGDALKALQLVDLGQQFDDFGITAEDYQGTEAIIVSVLVDDSGSIRFASNAQAVRDGHNGVIDALTGSKQLDQILMLTQYLSSGKVLNAFVLLENATRLDTHNYDPMGGTPLYDNILALLGRVLAKTQEYQTNGIPVRTVTLIVTDGHDEGSVRSTARDVSKVVTEMLMSEQHIIAAMGIDDGRTNFHQVFTEMGVRPEWILTPQNNPSDIRKAFAVFSQSALRASQAGASFSQVAVGGGFASP